ncbi:Hint domain-containing protein [Acetobacter cerevisiae]|uniref:Hint domain-containing protein n=1 Tax=Acetobacter cerevisiae TaxID=178900 RepID=A0ABT1ERS5_9PROT|nr:Hint domain-containing protein [Acetobacter cerevisiae]MCP1246079.1 Hint domain-containing protein [Acetobacter cerevisiae]MCP1255552.1 Hint domain-containing protein [Acetobacter cerevisiae]
MADYTNDAGVVYSIVPNGGLFPTDAVKITDPDGAVTNLGNVDAGHVLTQNGGTLSIASILGIGGGSFVIPPGMTGTVTTLISALSGATIYVGGTATITIAVSALSGMTVNVDGGKATMGNNLIAGALSGSTINMTNGGTFSNGSGLIGLLNGSTINFGKGGGNFIANAGGTLLDLSATTITGFDAARDFISFENLSAAPVTYSIANSLGSQVVTVYDAKGQRIADVNISGQNFTVGDYSANGAGPLTVSSDGTSLSIEAVGSVCFLPGTLLRTPEGEVTVEDVQIGDTLLTFENGKPVAQPVVWVGSKQAEVRPALPLDEAGWPVRVRQDALADGVPSKDLLITPEHCLYLDGQFVPVRMLVNGETIAYDQTIRAYTYYHVETAQHAVIMADGALTESYLDTGNRRGFRQEGTVVRIPGQARCWADDAAAPLMTAREAVEPLHQRLAQRAEMLRGAEAEEARPLDAATLTTEPDLHLVTESGAVINKVRTHNGQTIFIVPPHVQAVRLVSRASRPVDTIGPFVDDRRMLGVLVGRMMLQEGNKADIRELEPAAGTLAGSGWHAAEAGQTGRWTNGDAAVSLGERKSRAFGMLMVEVLAGGPYRLQQASAQARVAS